MRIDRCVCAGQTFAMLLRQARAEGWSLAQLAERTGATAGCGMCRPYVERTLRTGETVYRELLDERGEPVRGPGGATGDTAGRDVSPASLK